MSLAGVYSIENMNAISKFLAVSHQARNDGTSVRLWSAGGRDKLWRLSHVNENIYTIENVNAPGLFLAVSRQARHKGANVVLWSGLSPDKQWKVSRVDGDIHIIENANASGMLLSVSWQARNNGAKVVLWSGAGFDKQWRLQKQSGTVALFHASSKTNHDSIKQNGLKASRTGRMGPGVYFVFTLGQAQRIGREHCGGDGCYDVWKVEIEKAKTTLNVDEHPPWCGMEKFQEVLVPENDMIGCVVECVYC